VAGSIFSVTNYTIGKLPAGVHTLTIKADALDIVAEASETDNSYTKTISIAPAVPVGIVLEVLSLGTSPPQRQMIRPFRPAALGDPLSSNSLSQQMHRSAHTTSSVRFAALPIGILFSTIPSRATTLRRWAPRLGFPQPLRSLPRTDPTL
jgi:hypothetical protein